MMSSFQNLSRTQKTQAALHKDVHAICNEACHLLGLEITKPAIEMISELVFKKCSVYGTDLEAFSKHGKRSTINTEDVKLLVRRNSSLRTHINTIRISPATKEKHRKTNATRSVDPNPKESPREKDQEGMIIDHLDLTID